MEGLRASIVMAVLLAVAVAAAAPGAKTSRVREAVREVEISLLRAADRVRAFRVTESVRNSHVQPEAPEGRFARGLSRLGVATDVTGVELPADVAQKIAALLLREESWPADPDGNMDHRELIDPKYAFWLESSAGAVAVLWDPRLAQVQIHKVPEPGDPDTGPDFTGKDFDAANEIQALLQECLPVAPPEEDHSR